MAKLPQVSGKKVVKALGKLGWKPIRQAGSHIILMRDGSDTTLSVPLHDVLKIGLLGALLKDAGITVDDFLQTL